VEKIGHRGVHPASLPQDWTPILKEECDKVGIDFFTSPYDYESIEHVDPYIPAYKSAPVKLTG
jgi:sialic acid synthase SpsE